MIVTLDNTYKEIGLTSVQFQIKSKNGRIGIIHSASKPADNLDSEFKVFDDGLNYSLGRETCWAKSARPEETVIAVTNI